MSQLIIQNYNEQEIEFEMNLNKDLMVNATEMAKIFDKKVENFTRIEPTKEFIDECLKNANKRYLQVEGIEDIIISRQKSGTWMYRVLALKFAAWLSPAFELWVYRTIDQILFGKYRELEAEIKQSADRKNRIDELKKELSEDERYIELEQLELGERQAAYRRGKHNRSQLDLFRNSK
ncbi:MAG: KilA-N domain-containing protein [Bacteroidota bacterium]